MRDGGDTTTDGDGSQFDDLDRLFLCALKAVDVTGTDDPWTPPPIDTPDFEHIASDMSLVDYAQELAFLPDLTELALNKLDYTGDNVICNDHTEAQREKLISVLQKHEGIMISSDNALPPPAYGVVCDIDVQGHDPIKQQARTVPLRHLSKL